MDNSYDSVRTDDSRFDSFNTTWDSHKHQRRHRQDDFQWNPESYGTDGSPHQSGFNYSNFLAPLTHYPHSRTSSPRSGSSNYSRAYSPRSGSPTYSRGYSPRSGSSNYSRTYSPRSGSSNYSRGYSPRSGSPTYWRTSSPRPGSRTHSPRSSGSYEEEEYSEPSYRDSDFDTSLEDEVFDEGTVPTYLDYARTPEGVHVYPHLALNRGFYPQPQESGSYSPSPQPPPRYAPGTVKLSPHTPLISRFSRFGYTNPRDRILNIPPGDDIIAPTAMRQAVSISSPGRSSPLQLNVQVEPKSISRSDSGNHIVCDIGIELNETISEDHNPFFTPPVTETVRHYDRRHGMFTPRSIYKKGYTTIRNIFDVSPEPYTPRTPPLDSTIEWEENYLRRQAGEDATPTGRSPPRFDPGTY